MKYSAILFDLDGTLVDSRRDLANAINAMLMEFGYPVLHIDLVTSAVGDGVSKLITRCLDMAGASQISLIQAKPIFATHYQAHLVDHTRAYDGVSETLQTLKKALPLAIVSNKPEKLCYAVLQELGLLNYFELVIGGDSFRERKPHAMPVEEACKRLDLEPGNALMVGDSTNDIRAARAAGVKSAAVLYGFQEEALLKREQADYYLLSFKELLSLVESESA
jgi:phosphoglycolate phosphatase